jgi:membrane protein
MLARGWQLASKTVDEFSMVRADLLAAALAFNTLLSMAPLIIVAVAIAGIVLGESAAHAEVTRLLSDTLGAKGSATVNEWVVQASDGGKVASVVGIGLMLITASRLGTALRETLNQIWHIDVFMAEGFKSTVKDYVQRRMFAFALVAAAGPLLLVVFTSRTVLTGFHGTLFGSTPWQGLAIQILQLFVSFTIVALVSAVVFRYVPDTRVGWKNTLLGGALTSLLFNIGNVLVGLYLARASVTAAYGAAGSAVVVLLWLYFSAQMFLLGGAFTHVCACELGDGLSREEKRELAIVQDTARNSYAHATPEAQRASELNVASPPQPGRDEPPIKPAP